MNFLCLSLFALVIAALVVIILSPAAQVVQTVAQLLP
jgi:hypothetical protein